MNKGFLVAAAIIAIAFPMLEIVSIYQTWQWLGWWTLLWLLTAVGLGMALVLDAQGGWPFELGAAMLAGQDPFMALKGIGLRLVAAGLFIFPGMLSDALGGVLLLYLLFMPETRRAAAPPRQEGKGVIEGEFRRMDE